MEMCEIQRLKKSFPTETGNVGGVFTLALNFTGVCDQSFC